MKVKKNTFEKMCDKLEEQYLQDTDEITFVEKYIKEEIGQERNKLMKIRAEAREDDFWAFQSIWLNALALIAALMGIAYQILGGEDMTKVGGMILVVYMLLLIWSLYRLDKIHKFKTVGVWRKYVLEVCDELLAEEDSVTYVVKVKKQEEDKHDI